MIDKNRLSRDYEKEPVRLREILPIADLQYLYLDLNLNMQQISEFLGINSVRVSRMLRHWKLEKCQEMKTKSNQEYFMKKLGVKNPGQLKSSQDKMKKTMLEKYGVDNIAKLPEIQDKKRKTNLERYGVDNVAKSSEFIEKAKQTNLKKYGVESPQVLDSIKEKYHKTMKDKYGCSAPIQNLEIKNKIEETNLEKYGFKNAFQNKEVQEKQKQTIQEKYGVDNAFKLESIRDKFKQTCMDRYGVDNPWKCEEIKAKRKQTWKHKYDVDNPSKNTDLQEKKYETMHKNNTFSKSSCEAIILKLLEQKFEVVRTQYKSKEYPFSCDFYIEDIELYIEYNGYPSHGSEPYDINNSEHHKIVKILQEKSKQITSNGTQKDQYKNWIHTWTISDPLKRETAKRCKLNYLEFFNMEDFLNWYSVI